MTTYSLNDESTTKTRMWTIRKGRTIVKRSKTGLSQHNIDDMARRESIITNDPVLVQIRLKDDHRDYTITPDDAHEHRQAIREIIGRALGKPTSETNA